MEPAKLTRLVRGELDWIAMKALSKDRNRRYETANDLARDLQRYLAGEPVEAAPPSGGLPAAEIRRQAPRGPGDGVRVRGRCWWRPHLSAPGRPSGPLARKQGPRLGYGVESAPEILPRQGARCRPAQRAAGRIGAYRHTARGARRSRADDCHRLCGPANRGGGCPRCPGNNLPLPG